MENYSIVKLDGVVYFRYNRQSMGPEISWDNNIRNVQHSVIDICNQLIKRNNTSIIKVRING